MENFAVKSESFALYEAFKKDVEKIGYSYNAVFGWGSEDVKDSFCRKRMNNSNCLYFSDKWNSVAFPLSFAFSNSGDAKSFHLESQYGEALAFAKEVWEKEHKVEVYSLGCRLGHILANSNANCNISINATLDVSALNMCPLISEFYKNEKWLPQRGDYFAFYRGVVLFLAISKQNTKDGDRIISSTIYDVEHDHLYANNNTDNDTIFVPASPTQISFLDTVLAEQGKRFDKEKLELVDIPKHKEPIIGELAIGWSGVKARAIVGILNKKDISSMPYFISVNWFENAILFESPEQYKAFLKS